MKNRFSVKFILLVGFLLISLIVSLFAPERTDQIKVISAYPATVCPAIGNNVSSIAGVTSAKIGRRLIDGSSKKLNPGRSNQIPLTK